MISGSFTSAIFVLPKIQLVSSLLVRYLYLYSSRWSFAPNLTCLTTPICDTNIQMYNNIEIMLTTFSFQCPYFRWKKQRFDKHRCNFSRSESFWYGARGDTAKVWCSCRTLKSQTPLRHVPHKSVSEACSTI